MLTGGIGGMVTGLPVAEKLGVPFIATHLQPVGASTAAYAGVMFAGVPRWLGGWGRRMSHHLSEAAVWLPFLPAMRQARRQVLGLTGKPRAADPRWPALYGFSRHVVPTPAGRTRERIATGYWTLPATSSWSPPPGLEKFLTREGPPVVSIGFGSMASRDPAAATALVRGAVRDAGVRAVLLAGWRRHPPPTLPSFTPRNCLTTGYSTGWPPWCITAGRGRPGRLCARVFPPSWCLSPSISPFGLRGWWRLAWDRHRSPVRG